MTRCLKYGITVLSLAVAMAMSAQDQYVQPPGDHNLNVEVWHYKQMQNRPKRQLSREEFDAKKRAFVIQKASLTQSEADKYYALEKKKRERLSELGGNIAQQEAVFANKENVSEEEYGQALEKIYNARIEMARIEKRYHFEYSKFLSNEKIYKIHAAEIEFHRAILKRMVQ